MPTRTTRATKSPRKRAPLFTAKTADRHALYQLAVQAPVREAKFLSRYFEKAAGRPLRTLREDFCGTALLATHFVRLHNHNRAIGVDLDLPTLEWGVRHNVNTLLDEEQKLRLMLLDKDVRKVTKPRADAIAALNFSYSTFQTRSALLAYFRSCHAALLPGGMLFLDNWGGPDVQGLRVDRTRHQGFDYVWEQQFFDPISHHIQCAISFEFRDGTAMRNAFVYDWRLWTIPELRELMAEAGFVDVHVLWEGTDAATCSGNGIYRRREIGEPDSAWVVYVVGHKRGGRAVDRK